MSSLFSQTTPVGGDSIEGTVQSVDVQRFVCTVKTTKGQRYNNVIWTMPSGGAGRSGASYTPKMGDRVKLSTGLGYPVIDGFLPRIDRDPTSAHSIDSGSSTADTGKLTPLEGNSFNSSKPGDMLAGDHITTSEGGGMLAVLRGGTVVMKASALAQFIVSKLDDVARVVGRNIELMSEVGVEAFVSTKGTIYKYSGYARTVAESRQGLFRYQEMYGDTDTALALKDAYELGSVGAAPTPGGPLKRTLIVDATGLPLRVEEVDLLGNTTHTTQSADLVSTSTVTNTQGAWSLTTTNGTFCNITQTNGMILINYNNEATVQLDATGIVAKKGSSVAQVLNDSILMDASGHFVHITSAGVQMG
jgi:hypothetical protein